MALQLLCSLQLHALQSYVFRTIKVTNFNFENYLLIWLFVKSAALLDETFDEITATNHQPVIRINGDSDNLRGDQLFIKCDHRKLYLPTIDILEDITTFSNYSEFSISIIALN